MRNLRSLRPSGSARRRALVSAWRPALGAGALLVLAACTAAPPPKALPVVPGEDRQYLLTPAEGYPLTIDRERALRVDDAYRALVERADNAAASAVASQLLDQDPGFHPARVLLAQTQFLARDPEAVTEGLSAVTAELPTYTAAALLLGRAAELVRDLPLAYRAFHGAASVDALAAERAAALLDPALEQLAARLDENLRRQRLDDAEASLRLMRAWAPAAESTLLAARAMAVARGDGSAELVAVRSLCALHPEDRGLLERRADLEVEFGDPKGGMQIFDALLRGEPGNPRLQGKLGAARFRWRMQLLPARVREVAKHAQLDRGELALLLYWLLPDVRYGQASSARIATDVLDHPYREEIVRVVNLGLMDVDESLHRFGADRAASRPEAAAAVLRVLARDRRAACLAESPSSIGRDIACDLAVRCGLAVEDGDCLPGLPLSGSAALDLIQRAVDLLGGR